jgi:CxxC motif-containing protein
MSTEEKRRDLVCISCPVGCRLEAVRMEDGGITVTGNQCPKGEDYAREEINAPKRIVTTTVALAAGRVPVRTDLPLPVEKIDALLSELYALRLEPPVRRGDVIVDNFDNTGVQVIASLTVLQKNGR